MADNTVLAAGSGGDTLATDDIGGVKYPRSKIVIGADGTNDGDVSSANPLPIAGAVTNAGTFAVQASQTGTWTVTGAGGSFPVTDSGGSLTVDAPVGTPLFVRLSDGTSAITTLAVSLASVPSHPVTNAGTFAVQAAQSGTWNIGTVTTVTTCSAVTAVNGSSVAHDAVDSGNPHKIGARAVTSLSAGTSVADADRTDVKASVDGAIYTRSIALEDIVTATPVVIADGSSTSVIAAQGAGIKIYLTEVIIANTSASNITVDLRNGVGGAVLATFPVPANGGVVKTLHTPLPFAANTAVAADPSAAASSITVTLLGFKSKV